MSKEPQAAESLMKTQLPPSYLCDSFEIRYYLIATAVHYQVQTKGSKQLPLMVI